MDGPLQCRLCPEPWGLRPQLGLQVWILQRHQFVACWEVGGAVCLHRTDGWGATAGGDQAGSVPPDATGQRLMMAVLVPQSVQETASYSQGQQTLQLR